MKRWRIPKYRDYEGWSAMGRFSLRCKTNEADIELEQMMDIKKRFSNLCYSDKLIEILLKEIENG